MKKVLIVVGTRPNFIKITQFKKIAKEYPSLEFKIVHTGQHYDTKMANVFFEQLDLAPDFFLNIPAVSANAQIGHILIELEKLINDKYKPDLMIVVGDVNSTFAASVTANKMNIPIAHLESGLRSFDKTMPEENNRILTDTITDYFFITEISGIYNLKAEKHKENNMFHVGNTMIDTMVAYKPQIAASGILNQLGIREKKYVLMTMHRPATVDDKKGLLHLSGLINRITKQYKVIFPIHPRTLKNMEQLGVWEAFKKNQELILTEPLDYFSFQKLIAGSRYIITDSGGIQEESTFLKIPCLTLRPNTERPVTVEIGTNTLVPFELKAIEEYILQIENGTYKQGAIPEFWDGQATNRIVKILHTILNK